jgi:murein DD-endopeptidase MepM/ murein hydrolase activator NlpD
LKRRPTGIGLIGTSGNSTTPHVHFQLLSTTMFFPSNSLPYVFDQFDLQGRITQRLWDDNLGWSRPESYLSKLARHRDHIK